MNIVIYARVSTEEQTIEPQTMELVRFAQREGWNVDGIFSDVLSGAKAKRPGMLALLDRIKAGGIDAFLAVKLDRIGRSVLNVALLLEKLDSMGCALICPGQGIDTRKSNPAGRFQLAMLSAVAAFERDLISDRTKAGLAVARSRGVKLGRPSHKLVKNPDEVIAKWREAGGTFAELAKQLGGVSVSHAHKLGKAPKVSPKSNTLIG